MDWFLFAFITFIVIYFSITNKVGIKLILLQLIFNYVMALAILNIGKVL